MGRGFFTAGQTRDPGKAAHSTPAKVYDPSLAEVLIVQLGTALHRFGAPVYHLEETIAQIATALGLQGQFMCTPTSLTAAFGPHDEPQNMHLVRVNPGEVNLTKLQQLDALAHAMMRGEVGVAHGMAAVERVVAAPPTHGWARLVPAYGLTSAAFAVLLGGGWRAMWVAGLIGLLIGLLARLATQWAGLGKVFAMVAAVLSSLTAYMLADFLPGASMHVATVAGLIMLLPGLTLTVAMVELATLNLVSGTARLMGVVVSFLQIGFGVAVGTRLAWAIERGLYWLTGVWPGGADALLEGAKQGAAQALPDAVPAWFFWGAFVVAATTFTLLLQAPWSEWVWIVAVSLVAAVGTRLGTALLGNELGPLLSVFLVTLASNVYSRGLRRFAMITLVPGLLLQVPGSLAYRSISELFSRDVVLGMGTAFSVVSIAVAMVAGVLLANACFPPTMLKRRSA